MNIKEIEQTIEEGVSLKTIAQAYSEIANLKIRRIRKMVERNRYFFLEIYQVYSLIKKLAVQKGVVVKKPKNRVALILTSNYRFYGNVNNDLIEFFINAMNKLRAQDPTSLPDIILLGKAAIDYVKATQSFSNYQSVMLKKDQPDAQELTQLINLISPYNQVLVFHSRLKSLMTQLPMVTDITASSADQMADILKKDNFRFIFEPDLPKILSFFDSQILTLLLESTFLESELSRTASRFISMDGAENEANKLITEYQKLGSYVKKNLINHLILENFATMSARKEVS